MADLSKELNKELSKDFAYCEDALGGAENAIGNLPSAQPEPKWIPCRESNGNIHPYSELLHERKDILVTYKTRTGRRYVKQVLCNHGRVEKILLGDIVAWLPLPTPYREDEEE